MGQNISISSLVDELSAVPPEGRRAALEAHLQNVSKGSALRMKSLTRM